jgi:predicted nucleotidyltransferase
MPNKPYSISDIQKLIQPIAVLYGVERVVLFGSYARGNATPESDVDIHIDKGAIRGYFRLAGFHRDLEDALDAQVDVLTTGALDEEFLSHIAEEEVVLYERAG